MNWDLDNKVLLQGFFSSVEIMENNGTNIVAAVGEKTNGENQYSFPIFNLVEQAIAEFGQIKTSIIFNHSYEVLDAVSEAIFNGIKQIIINTSNIPPLDLFKVFQKAESNDVLILGPGNAGIIIPEKLCFGNIDTKFYKSGKIGIISTGDWSLNYEVALALNQENMGQSIAINLGNDPLLSNSIFSWLTTLENHQETEAIVLVINNEKYVSKKDFQETIKDILSQVKKQVVAYVPNYKNVELFDLNNNSKMIADQIPSFLEKVTNKKQIISYLKKEKVTIANSILDIPKLVKSKDEG